MKENKGKGLTAGDEVIQSGDKVPIWTRPPTGHTKARPSSLVGKKEDCV